MGQKFLVRNVLLVRENFNVKRDVVYVRHVDLANAHNMEHQYTFTEYLARRVILMAAEENPELFPPEYIENEIKIWTIILAQLPEVI